MEIRPFTIEDIDATVELWRLAELLSTKNDPRRDIERKLGYSPWGFLVMVEEDKIIGAIMVGYDGSPQLGELPRLPPGLPSQGRGSRAREQSA